ncbi:hypothetical protein BDGGKGIB_03259 [Nodularia sphaerocarpa UHCC 0038]|nr:hypothetical protein BDGGKGIB_03259 [Nodularia sphaerocarpa UHCC 0038]
MLLKLASMIYIPLLLEDDIIFRALSCTIRSKSEKKASTMPGFLSFADLRREQIKKKLESHFSS